MTTRESLNEAASRGENYKLLYSNWTKWRTIMSINPIEGLGQYKDRSGEAIGLKYTEQLNAFQDDCGIYELRIVLNSRRGQQKIIVVYVGSSCGTGKGVRSRLKDYARDGSHKKRYINAALKNGAIIEARAKTTDACDKKTSGEWENELLEKYDYVWNIRNNWTERKDALYFKAFVSDIV